MYLQISGLGIEHLYEMFSSESSLSLEKIVFNNLFK